MYFRKPIHSFICKWSELVSLILFVCKVSVFGRVVLVKIFSRSKISGLWSFLISTKPAQFVFSLNIYCSFFSRAAIISKISIISKEWITAIISKFKICLCLLQWYFYLSKFLNRSLDDFILFHFKIDIIRWFRQFSLDTMSHKCTWSSF